MWDTAEDAAEEAVNDGVQLKKQKSREVWKIIPETAFSLRRKTPFSGDPCTSCAFRGSIWPTYSVIRQAGCV